MIDLWYVICIFFLSLVIAIHLMTASSAQSSIDFLWWMKSPGTSPVSKAPPAKTAWEVRKERKCFISDRIILKTMRVFCALMLISFFTAYVAKINRL